MSIDLIDQRLAKYYKKKGRNDYYDDGVGKFKQYCVENGFEDDGLEEEMDQEDAEDCMFVEFDDNFPFKTQPSDEKEQKTIILSIIKKCYNGESLDENADFITHAKDWNIPSNELKSTMQSYAKQCPQICNSEMGKDTNFITILSIGDKFDAPFLQLLTDTYSRDRLQMDSSTSPQQWALTNPYCAALRKKKLNDAVEKIESAIASFNHRIAPKLALEPQYIINHSLKDVSEYIYGAFHFIYGLIQKEKNASICPFQIDFSMIFSDVVEKEDDEEDKNDDDDAIGGDYFGNIKQNLDAAKSIYLAQTRMDEQDAKNDEIETLQIFKNHWDLFRRKQVKTKYDDKEFASYPNKKRICILIDKRKPDKDSKYIDKEDEIIFYETNKKTTQLPDNPKPIWYFAASTGCIIPGKNNQSNVSIKQQQKTALTGCYGSLMVVSFHVVSTEEIRAYLFLNGQCIRFLPQDIIGLLPKYFVDNEENKQFVKGNKIKE
eukprot:144318_1